MQAKQLLIPILLAAATTTTAYAGGADDAAILKVHDDFAASWNKGDYQAMAAQFADDADLINPLGTVAKGKAQITDLYKREQTGPLKGTHFSSDCKTVAGGVRMLTADVAVVTCAFEVTGAKAPPMKGIYTATMVKAKGKWQIVAGRPMIPVVPPSK